MQLTARVCARVGTVATHPMASRPPLHSSFDHAVRFLFHPLVTFGANRSDRSITATGIAANAVQP